MDKGNERNDMQMARGTMRLLGMVIAMALSLYWIFGRRARLQRLQLPCACTHARAHPAEGKYKL
jgi:hypothetical protein